MKIVAVTGTSLAVSEIRQRQGPINRYFHTISFHTSSLDDACGYMRELYLHLQLVIGHVNY